MGFMFVIYFRSRILLHIWVVAAAGQPGSAAEIAREVSASASSLTREGATESAPSHPDDRCLPRGDLCPVQELDGVFLQLRAQSSRVSSFEGSHLSVRGGFVSLYLRFP